MASGAWSDSGVERSSPARVLMAGMMWRSLGTRSAGETLARAMASGDEQNQMLAGMSLVKAGERSVGLIEEKVKSGEASPSLVRLLMDFESSSAEQLLRKLSAGETGELSAVASECLDHKARISQF